MDPDAILINMRAAVKAAYGNHDDDVQALIEHFEALDGWLSRGGFAPFDWLD